MNATESKIKKAREEANISRAKMSRLLEIPIRTIEDWEAGRRTPAHWAEKLIVEKLKTLQHEE